MAELSGINFKKSNAINTEYNDRTLPPNYLLSDSLGVECSLSHDKSKAFEKSNHKLRNGNLHRKNEAKISIKKL